MRFKTDWLTHLHETRKKEVDKAFQMFSGRVFESGLEVGAGDGFQTSLIASRFKKFTATDLNFDRISIKVPGVTYIQADADNFAGCFGPEEFDIIFSSSFLEHISDPIGFLKNSAVNLKKDGYAIHIVPNRFMKVAYITLFYPNLFLLILDRIVGLFQGKKVFRGTEGKSENNINSEGIKIPAAETGKFKKIFLPSVHGMYKSHTEEFRRWGKGEWRTLFKKSGYTIVKEVGTSVHSGYGFGFNAARKFLERLGFASLTIFILKK